MKTVYNIQNNYDNTSNPSQQYQPGITLMEKLFEVLDKRDAVMAENRKLYEALLQVEREKNALLTELLKEKQLESVRSA
jgi:hypothetical protein